MFIQTETTPNPATLKFLPGLSVPEAGTADFPSAEAAAKSPLAKRIFAVPGVTAVFFGSDFVTVTKDAATLWDHAKPAILGAIMEHFQSGAPVIEGGVNRVPFLDQFKAAEGKTKLVGDVAYKEVSAVAGAITPVPGGVGLMTVACLLQNTVTAAKRIAGLEA